MADVNIKKTCRICLNDQLNQEIISPCNCSGSMKYVHKKCLYKWLKVKGFNCKCEICEYQFKKEKGEFIGIRKSVNRIINQFKNNEHLLFYWIYIMLSILSF